jgi:hypothetical protein
MAFLGIDRLDGGVIRQQPSRRMDRRCSVWIMIM